MAQENIDVTVRLHDQLSRPAEGAERSVEELQNEVAELNASMAALKATSDKQAKALKALSRASGKTSKDLDQANDRLKKGRNSAAFAAAAFGGLGAAMSKSSKESKGLGTAMKALKLPAIMTAASLAAGGIAAIGAAAVSAVAGLAPLVGLAGAIPALGTAALQAKGVFTLAMQGIGDAVKVLSDPKATAAELSAALKDLGGDERNFAIALAKAKEEAEGLRDISQAGLLPGLQRALGSVMPLLPVVERNLGKTASVLGAAAQRAGAFAGTLRGDLNTAMERNTRIVEVLGGALVPVVNIFRNLLITGGPLAERFARAVAAGATQLDRWVQAGRDSGRLEAFFKRAGDLGAAVGKVIGDIAVGLFNVGKESGALSSMMGEGIAGAAARFREFTESAAGAERIRQFFTDAIPLVRETAWLIRDVVKAFGGLANNQDLAPIISAVRTDLLPAVQRLAEGVTTGLGPAIVDLATAWAEFANVLSFSPLITAVGIIGDLARAVTGFIQLTPGLSVLIATLLTIKLVSAVMLTLGKMTGITTLLTSTFTKTLFGSTAALTANGAAKTRSAAAGLALRNMLLTTIPGLLKNTAGWIANTASAVANRAAAIAVAVAHRVQMLPALVASTAATVKNTAVTVASTVAAKAIRVAVIAWTVAQKLLNLALRANPIGIVITVLALLAGAIVMAWKRSETFRNVVLGVWDKVKSAFNVAWAFIRDKVFAPMGNFFTKTIPGWLGAVRDGFRSGVDFISRVWSELKEKLKAPVQWVIDFVWNNGLRKLWNAINNLWDGRDLEAFRFSTGGTYAPPRSRPGVQEFATGGVLPGYTPGRDVHRFVSPTGGRLELSGGEAIMRPEFTRAVGGAAGVAMLNSMAMRQGSVSLQSALAGGGVWGREQPQQSFAAGGVVQMPGWLEDALGGFTSLLPGGGILKNVVQALIDNINNGDGYGGGMLGSGLISMVGGVASKLWAAAKELFTPDDGPLGGVLTPNGSGGLGPAAIKAFNFVRSFFGFTGTIGGYAYRNIAGTNQLSKHALGKAIDVMTYTNMALGQRIADFFAGPGRGAFGVDNVIWNRRIHSGRGWSPYYGVSPHTDHPHIDFFDRGGLASGAGLMPKMAIQPERILSPQQTQAFERLVQLLETNDPAVLARAAVQAQPVRGGGGGGNDGGSGLPPMHFHFEGGAGQHPTPEMRAWVLETVRRADREHRERR